MLAGVAETGFSKTQSQFTSHAARFTVSFGVSALRIDVMTAFCVGLFVYLLNLPFQLWPRF